MNLGASAGQNNAVRLEMWNGVAAVTAISAVSDITKGGQRGVAAWSYAGRSVAVRGTLATGGTPLWNTGAPAERYLGHSGGGLHVNGCLRPADGGA